MLRVSEKNIELELENYHSWLKMWINWYFIQYYMYIIYVFIYMYIWTSVCIQGKNRHYIILVPVIEDLLLTKGIFLPPPDNMWSIPWGPVNKTFLRGPVFFCINANMNAKRPQFSMLNFQILISYSGGQCGDLIRFWQKSEP